MMKKLARLLILVALAMPIAARAQEPVLQDGQGPGERGPRPQMPPPGGGMMERSHGGGPFGAWWKDSEIAKQIELTPDQTKQIEQKFLDSRLKLIDERADLEKQETLLGAMMDEDRPEEARVGGQLDKVVSARGKLEKENAMMMLSIRRVLSVDQWKKLQTLQRERMRSGGYSPFHPSMRRPGDGGPGGPGRRGPMPPQSPEPLRPPDGGPDSL
jgi:protein CpxP